MTTNQITVTLDAIVRHSDFLTKNHPEGPRKEIDMSDWTSEQVAAMVAWALPQAIKKYVGNARAAAAGTDTELLDAAEFKAFESISTGSTPERGQGGGFQKVTSDPLVDWAWYVCRGRLVELATKMGKQAEVQEGRVMTLKRKGKETWGATGYGCRTIAEVAESYAYQALTLLGKDPTPDMVTKQGREYAPKLREQALAEKAKIDAQASINLAEEEANLFS